MNIKQELDYYYSHGEEAIISILTAQRDEIDKKMHLIEIVHVLNSIEQIIKDNEFAEAGIEILQIRNYHDYDSEHNLVKFEILNKDKTIVNKYDNRDNYIPIYEKLKDLFEKVSLHDSFSNYNFKEKDELTFAVDENLVENLRWTFLSAELNASLSHALLDNDLTDKKLKSTKLKI